MCSGGEGEEREVEEGGLSGVRQGSAGVSAARV